MEPIRRIDRSAPRPFVEPVRRLRRPSRDEDREEPSREDHDDVPRRPGEEPEGGGLDVLA